MLPFPVTFLVVAMHSCELHSKDITLQQHRHGSSNNAVKGGYPTHMYVLYMHISTCMYVVCMYVCMYVLYVCI